MNIQSLAPGAQIQLNRNMIVKAFPTVHRVPSQGYALYSIKKGSLLSEYSNLNGIELQELKKRGATITSPDIPQLEIVYTGDTTIEFLNLPENSFILHAPVLVMELTYIDGERSKAQTYGHIHLDDIIDNANLFENIGEIIFVHFSQRYSFSKILQILQSRLPAALCHKVRCNLSSFGATEPLTSLVDDRYSAEVTANIAGWGWATNGSASSVAVSEAKGMSEQGLNSPVKEEAEKDCENKDNERSSAVGTLGQSRGRHRLTRLRRAPKFWQIRQKR